MGRTVTKFQIKVNGMIKGNWSFGACLIHGWGETYLHINLFKKSISIGWLNYYKNTVESDHKYGQWEYYDIDNSYYCTACGEIWALDYGTPEENGMNFCPNCGADMRGK